MPNKLQLPEELDTPEFAASWKAWEAHRREIKKKLTPTSVSRQIASLNRVGVANAIATIERSIQNGWCGLFPESLPPQTKGAAGIYEGLAAFARGE